MPTVRRHRCDRCGRRLTEASRAAVGGPVYLRSWTSVWGRTRADLCPRCVRKLYESWRNLGQVAIGALCCLAAGLAAGLLVYAFTR